MTSLAMPPQLGRYEVCAKLADGGMATLYLGRLHGPGGFERPVALKVIKDEYLENKEFVSMFLDEAKIVAKVQHPNVVQLFELGTEKDRLFIAMELLVGQSLWNVWQACHERQSCLRMDLIAWIGARVGEGLHHAHELTGADGKSIELVHRDVNASNIFLTYDGHVKLIDFGLVKATNRVSRTAEGIVKGKVAYMSPEQASGKPVDRRTDIFALGTTLWELTTDRRLFKAPADVDTLLNIKMAKVPDPTKLVAGYPPKLWAALSKALKKDPNERYATVADFAKDLDACATLEGRTVNAAALAQVMRALFAQERERQLAWIDQVATKPTKEVSVSNPYEEQRSYEEMASKVAPPPGTLDPLRQTLSEPSQDLKATTVEPVALRPAKSAPNGAQETKHAPQPRSSVLPVPNKALVTSLSIDVEMSKAEALEAPPRKTKSVLVALLAAVIVIGLAFAATFLKK